MHARKAWLKGLSPKDNRTIPPLDYPLVYELKRAHPGWPIIVNGGAGDLGAAQAHLAHVDGVMVGRAAYQNPEMLLGVDPAIFGEAAPFDDAFDALGAFMPTIAKGLERGERLHDYTRHLLGLFAGRPGTRSYRRALATVTGTSNVSPAASTPARLASEAASTTIDAPVSKRKGRDEADRQGQCPADAFYDAPAAAECEGLNRSIGRARANELAEHFARVPFLQHRREQGRVGGRSPLRTVFERRDVKQNRGVHPPPSSTSMRPRCRDQCL